MKNSNHDFTTGSIPRKLAVFMLPILAALIFQALYSTVDLFIIGKFGTTAGISGISTGGNILHIVMAINAALTTGISVLTGQYIGRKETERLTELLGSGIFFFILLSVVFTFCLVVFAPVLTTIMQAPEEAVKETITYLRICGFGVVFIVFYNFMSAIFRAMGDSKTPLIMVALSSVTNIIGDYVLVAIFKMDVAGAAIATVAAQGLSVLLSFVFLKKKLTAKLQRKHFVLGPETKRFLRIGLPLVGQELLTNVTFLCICAFINRLGLAASSGYGISQRIQSFVLLVPSALMQGMTPFVSQNVGAGLHDRAKQALRTGMLIGGSIGVVLTLFMYFKGDLIVSLFSNDAAVIKQGYDYLRGFSSEAIVTSIMFSFIGYYNGYSESMFVFLQGLGQSLLVRLPMSWFMSTRPNASLFNIGLAAPAATTFGIIINVIYMKKLQKKLKRQNV